MAYGPRKHYHQWPTVRISARPTCHAAMSTESPGRSIRAAAGDLCGHRRGVPQARWASQRRIFLEFGYPLVNIQKAIEHGHL